MRYELIHDKHAPKGMSPKPLSPPEKQKRDWIVEIIKDHPKHKFIYLPMLSDESDYYRKKTFNSFKKEIEARTERDVYSYNALDEYTGETPDWANYIFDFKKEFLKDGNEEQDVIIFVDPDIGFNSGNINEVKESKHINTKIILKLIKMVTDKSLIVCYQSRRSNSYIDVINDKLSTFADNNNIQLDDSEFQANKERCQLLLYLFTKDKNYLYFSPYKAKPVM